MLGAEPSQLAAGQSDENERSAHPDNAHDRSVLDWALAYADRTWSVFPVHPIASSGVCSCPAGSGCERAGKHPSTPHGLNDASADPNTIRGWFGSVQKNIGIRTGLVSGFIVLDIDPGKGGREALAALETEHGALPQTLVANTGSGGSHYLFRHPGGVVRNSVSKLGKGLDIRGDGGYIVAAPSNHISGGVYSWANDLPVVDVPTWLINLIRSEKVERVEPTEDFPPASAELLVEARALLKRHGPAVQSQGGDQHTFSAASTLVNDLALTIVEALPPFAEWNTTCQPPWRPEDLLVKLRNASRYAAGERGAKRHEFEFAKMLMADLASTPVDDPLARARALVQAHLGRDPERPQRLRFERVSDLLAKPAPATSWLVNGIIMEKAVVALSGEPKTTKTWCAGDISLGVSTCRPVFGEFVVPQRRGVALFLVEDDARSVRNRMRSLAAGRGLHPAALENLHVICRQTRNLLDDEHIVDIIAACLEIRDLGLVVLDPLRDLHAEEENDSTAMSKVMHRLRLIRDVLGVAVVFVHHSIKSGVGTNGRRQGQKMRGSSAIHGAVDGGIYLHDLETDGQRYWENRVSVEVKAARGAGNFRLRLDVKDDENGEAVDARWTHKRADAAPPKRLTSTEEKVRRLLEETWRKFGGTEHPLSQRQIADQARTATRSVPAIMKALAAAGDAKKTEAGWLYCPRDEDFNE